jgi:6,7-dimethyl-8-ribityllumazine synthase
MSGAGAAPYDLTGADGMRAAIIAASWHEVVMAGLVEGALEVCDEAGVLATVHRVPGSFELPIVAAAVAATGVDAVIALGVIIRGGTPHFEYVSQATTSGLTRVALDTGVPVGFGVLTCDTEEQALDRSGLPGSMESKGREAAAAAIATAVLLRDVRALQ